MLIALVIAAVLLSAASLLIHVLSLRRAGQGQPNASEIHEIESSVSRIEPSLREEAGRAREESASAARNLREEVGKAISELGATLSRSMTDVGSLQKEQLAAFADQLRKLGEVSGSAATSLRSELAWSLKTSMELSNKSSGDLRTEVAQSLSTFGQASSSSFVALQKQVKEQLESFNCRLDRLTQTTDTRLQEARKSIDDRLQQIQTENAAKLDQMRATVDEKLQGTLEKRLGESFKQVGERLEQVHKGLGEMQALATGVGDLKRVLSNVKVRGTTFEKQLGILLEQVLAPGQFATNIATKPGSADRVEFAIRLPGSARDGSTPVWLPIDSKCPMEDFERLSHAAERGDAAAVEDSARQLEQCVRACAKDISSKYLSPPHTTDFAILFLPTEGLYAEVVRRPGLADALSRDYHVAVAGPTNLWALLNSLQMGFRTLAIEKRSSEVWSVLGGVKTEFANFGGVLEKVQKKLQEASNTIDATFVRTRAIDRKLRAVQELPSSDAPPILDLPHIVNGEAEPDEA